MEYISLVRILDEMLRETYRLWDPGWVTFNWRAYTYDHVQRVKGLALNLCSQEGGNLRITELAALLHDITKPYDGEYVVDEEGKRALDSDGYWRNAVRYPVRSNAVTQLYDMLGLAGRLHHESGAIVAHHLLQAEGVDGETCAWVAETIRHHLQPPEHAITEAACLYDADTIDANIGLPAFIRNIYIHLHFHDARKDAGTPPIATLLREAPLDYLRPYVLENLPRWAAGKRRDFVPRLRSESARELAMARLGRLEAVFGWLAQELDDFASNGQGSCLWAVLHFMRHRDDPSIAAEVAYLRDVWLAQERSPRAQVLVDHLHREMVGDE